MLIGLPPELFRKINLFERIETQKVAAGAFILVTVDGNIIFVL